MASALIVTQLRVAPEKLADRQIYGTVVTYSYLRIRFFHLQLVNLNLCTANRHKTFYNTKLS